MGFEQAAALSSSFPQQDVQDSVPAWLFTQLSYDQTFRASNVHTYNQHADQSSHQVPWNPDLQRCKQDIDQRSISSVEDDVSISDSAHGSYSSEASSQTSWTSATESSDSFMDEDSKEQFPQLAKVNSYTAGEAQEPRSGSIPTNNDHSVFGESCTPCPIDNFVRSVKGGASSISRFWRQPCARRSQVPTQACSRSSVVETTVEPNVQHCRSRRSACSSLRQCPPKLKRDTDVTEQFVALLIVFAKRLITALWPSSDSPPMSTECFGAGVLPLETFIKETLRRSKTSFSTLQVALYYLILLRSRMPLAQLAAKCKGDTPERSQCRAMQCGRRMFLSALMLASKYLQDRNYSARAWSKISGLRSNEINENEREYLAKINYDLHVPKDMFENWSKIVLVLSKLSNERPCFQPRSFDASFAPPEADSNTSLAAMVSQVDLDVDEFGDFEQTFFTGEWWSSLLQKLEPSIIKEAPLADEFLRAHLPSNKLHVIASLPHLSREANAPLDFSTPSSNSVAHGEDLNFGDMNHARHPLPSGAHGLQTPQTPVQMSPAGGPALPSRPQLGNLPTPQTTPRICSQFSGEKSYSRPSLRFAASMDAMRSSLRKECFRKASLERCPPPQPQGVSLPSMSLIRSAATIQDLPTRTTTPLTASPASVSSDSTTTTISTSRSRSSSISSVSSWSPVGPTLPHLRRSVAACGLSSPLSRVCSLSDRSVKPSSTMYQTTNGEFLDQVCSALTSETSDKTPVSTISDGIPVHVTRAQPSNAAPTSSEVAAIHGLMSLSTQSETSSQSVTPTPQRLSEHGITSIPHCNRPSKYHKRKLSKTEPNLQAQVRDLVFDARWSSNRNIVDDPLLPYGGTMHRKLQVPTALRHETRFSLSNGMNNKRLCAQQLASSNPATLPLSEQRESNSLMCH